MSKSSDLTFPLCKASAIKNTPHPSPLRLYDRALVLLPTALLPKDIREWTCVCPETSAFKNKAETFSCLQSEPHSASFPVQTHILHADVHKYTISFFMC